MSFARFIIPFLLALLSLSNAWEKENYTKFENLSDAEFNRLYLNLKLSDLSEHFPRKNYSIFKSMLNLLPENFDGRDIWDSCIHPIINQYYCGSCYALSAASVLSDRFCVASQGAINVNLSPQYIVSCNPWTDGCQGGGLYSTWFFLEAYGIPTDSCIPYLSWLGDEIPCDFNDCQDNTTPLLFYARTGSTHVFSDKESIKLDLLNNGPIQAGFLVFADFKTYKSGVYVPENKTVVGAHAAKIVGWGVEDGKDYWLLGNSWGADWGENGYFRIIQDEAWLDKNAIAGLPDLMGEDKAESLVLKTGRKREERVKKMFKNN